MDKMTRKERIETLSLMKKLVREELLRESVSVIRDARIYGFLVLLLMPLLIFVSFLVGLHHRTEEIFVFTLAAFSPAMAMKFLGDE